MEFQSNTALTPGQESRWVLVQRAFRLSHWIWNMTIMIWLVDLRSGMVLSSSSSMVCHLLIPVKKWWIKEKKKFIYFSWTFFRLGLYFLVAQSLKSLPTMWETWVRSLVQEDPLEKEIENHSSIFGLEMSMFDIETPTKNLYFSTEN